TSANPHDGSSAHSNMAVRFSGEAVTDLFNSERAVLQFSGASQPAIDVLPAFSGESTEKLQILTESKIKVAVLDNIRLAGAGDRLDLMMFYLADREIIEALKDAHRRGVVLRVLLDPNKDAFGREKNGIPNRPVGHELHQAGVDVRWCDTHGEQCHSKTLLIHYGDGTSRLLTGSANFTRRNLQDFNLETDVQILAPRQSPVIREAEALFALQWNNTGARVFSAAYEKYRDDARWKYWLYRFMEASGMSTF
ncbi:MAG: phospholipase, partial [Gammaproteobacteria bacterium]|nr:phospholipase [Gammaproteobacteria bacterium]